MAEFYVVSIPIADMHRDNFISSTTSARPCQKDLTILFFTHRYLTVVSAFYPGPASCALTLFAAGFILAPYKTFDRLQCYGSSTSVVVTNHLRREIVSDSATIYLSTAPLHEVLPSREWGGSRTVQLFSKHFFLNVNKNDT